MQFKQIVLLDKAILKDEAYTMIQDWSQQPLIKYETNPQDNHEIITRIGDAEAVLVTWDTPIDKEVLDACPYLQAIFLTGTNTKAIDLQTCKEKNIVVSNVRDYSEEGVVEWIFQELLCLRRGVWPYQRRKNPEVLSGKTIGIIGMGPLAQLLVQAALGFDMHVLYTSRTRKENIEQQGAKFVSKQELLQQSDIISLQTPRDIIVLGQEEFALMQEKVLINNTLGKAFDEQAFLDRIAQPNNYLIMDAVSDFKDRFKDIERVIYLDAISSKTQARLDKLSQKVLDNIQAYLSGTPNPWHPN